MCPKNLALMPPHIRVVNATSVGTFNSTKKTMGPGPKDAPFLFLRNDSLMKNPGFFLWFSRKTQGIWGNAHFPENMMTFEKLLGFDGFSRVKHGWGSSDNFSEIAE